MRVQATRRPKHRTGEPLSEQLYASIKRDILTGGLEPGAAFTEQWLSKKYQVSRTPIREACLRLARDGLLEWVPQKGYSVSDLTLRDLHELFQLRTILEVAACELASGANRDPALLQEAEERCQATYQAGDQQGYLRFLEANHAFHLLIARMTRNRRLVDELDRVLVHFVRLFSLIMPPDSVGPEMIREHRALLEAIDSGDADKARQETIGHIQRSKERAIRYFLA